MRRANLRKLTRRPEAVVLLAIIVFSALITAVNPSFFTLENLFDLLKSYSFMGILSIGVLIVLISGGIDISFTATASICAYVTVVLLVKETSPNQILLAFLLSAVIGTALGSINALIIYFFSIPSIIVTIATLNIYYGMLTVLSGGTWLIRMPDWFREVAQIKFLVRPNAEGVPYGISIVTVIWFAVILIGWALLRYTMLGRGIYAVGGSMPSARRAGFNILGIQLFAYGFLGLLAGIAGLVQALQGQAVQPNGLVGKELDVIAAVVLGGASLSGGSGSVAGTVLGVALIAILSNGLTLMRVSSFWYNVCIGLAIIISVSINAYRQKSRAGKLRAVEVA
jgi:simple sugar transport system permease protein